MSEDIIKRLSEKLPDEAVQRTKGTETKKGYDTTGYGYQYAVDRFNDILGAVWGFDWHILNEKEGQYKSGMLYNEITVQVSIWIDNEENSRSCVGGHTGKDYADALKGAITNGFKKTAAFWGVGRDAFAGTIDDDNKPLPDSAENKVKKEFNGTELPTVEVMKMKTADLSDYSKKYFRELKYTLPEVYEWCKPHNFDADKIEKAIKEL